MEELSGGDTDQLAIVVSAEGNSKLLGEPKVASGKGADIAKAVVDCFYDWNLQENVQSMCFDTSASNTGANQGACKNIEPLLGRSLLNLACRHHVNEIIISDVFKICHNVSSGPEISIFKRFQKFWSNIKVEKYEIADSDIPEKKQIISFCKNHLKNHQPRADYKELLELTIIYLGDVPLRGIKFSTPSAVHRAR